MEPTNRKEGVNTEQETNEVTRQKVLEELACIAFSRATDYVTVQGGKAAPVDSDRLSDAAARAIVSIKEGTRGVEVKLGDKLRALELLARVTGLFEPGGQEESPPPCILDDL